MLRLAPEDWSVLERPRNRKPPAGRNERGELADLASRSRYPGDVCRCLYLHAHRNRRTRPSRMGRVPWTEQKGGLLSTSDFELARGSTAPFAGVCSCINARGRRRVLLGSVGKFGLVARLNGLPPRRQHPCLRKQKCPFQDSIGSLPGGQTLQSEPGAEELSAPCGHVPTPSATIHYKT